MSHLHWRRTSATLRLNSANIIRSTQPKQSLHMELVAQQTRHKMRYSHHGPPNTSVFPLKFVQQLRLPHWYLYIRLDIHCQLRTIRRLEKVYVHICIRNSLVKSVVKRSRRNLVCRITVRCTPPGHRTTVPIATSSSLDLATCRSTNAFTVPLNHSSVPFATRYSYISPSSLDTAPATRTPGRIHAIRATTGSRGNPR